MLSTSSPAAYSFQQIGKRPDTSASPTPKQNTLNGFRFNDFLANSNRERIVTKLLIPDEGETRMVFLVRDLNDELRDIGSVPVEELGFDSNEIAVETVAMWAAHSVDPERVQLIEHQEDEDV